MQTAHFARVGGSVAGIVAALVSCARPAVRPDALLALEEPPKQQSVTVLADDDWRRVLVGSWNTTFVLDSVATVAAPDVWRRGASRAASGHLTVYDSLVRAFPAVGLRRSALPNLRRVLGRPLSCSEPDWLMLGVERLPRDRIQLRFTPESNDCGLLAIVSGTQDSLSGKWSEPSLGMPVAVGTVKLTKER